MLSGVEDRLRAGLFAAMAGALLSGAAAMPALAQGPRSLNDALFGEQRRDEHSLGLPLVARFRDEVGDRFVLDRSSRTPLLRFEDSPEIWVLKPTPGPHGDIIFRNDVGDPMLRAMRFGGLTLFTPEQPTGAAAAPYGAAQPLRLPPVATPAQLLQTLIQASTRASRMAQHLIVFETPDYTLGAEPVWADAAMLTAEAFVRVGAAGRNGREAIARFISVRFYPGKSPSASVAGREVRIYVSVKDGLAGRPSSKRIATVIAAR